MFFIEISYMYYLYFEHLLDSIFSMNMPSYKDYLCFKLKLDFEKSKIFLKLQFSMQSNLMINICWKNSTKSFFLLLVIGVYMFYIDAVTCRFAFQSPPSMLSLQIPLSSAKKTLGYFATSCIYLCMYVHMVYFMQFYMTGNSIGHHQINCACCIVTNDHCLTPDFTGM